MKDIVKFLILASVFLIGLAVGVSCEYQNTVFWQEAAESQLKSLKKADSGLKECIDLLSKSIEQRENNLDKIEKLLKK